MAHKEPVSLEIKYLGKTPRAFQTPIPFMSTTERTGEVICDPTGIFSVSDGKYLLALDPVFQLVREIYSDEQEEDHPSELEETPLPEKEKQPPKKKRGNPNWKKKENVPA